MRDKIVEVMARGLAEEIAKPAHENLDEVPSRGEAMAACLALSRAALTALQAEGMAVVPVEDMRRLREALREHCIEEGTEHGQRCYWCHECSGFWLFVAPHEKHEPGCLAAHTQEKDA